MKKLLSVLGLILLFSFLLTGQTKTGTLKIFSELTGIVVYLDEIKQVEDVQVIENIPVGSHYLKALLGGASVFGELIEIKEGTVTTVLIKNTGQVQEKILETKIPQMEEYQNKKIDVIFSSNSISQTKGASTLFPGYYGYYGFSNSVTSTTQIADFKIIEGGVKEIPDIALARLSDNKSVMASYGADFDSWGKFKRKGDAIFIVSTVPFLVTWIDMALKKPFLHENPTGESMNLKAVPKWEWATMLVSLATMFVGYKMSDAPQSIFIKPHYYKVDEAAKDAQEHNRKLKDKLGLPASYDLIK